MATICVCGDVVNYRHPDGIFCSSDLGAVVSGADYSVVNCEAPVQGYGAPQPKSGPHHSQRVETIAGLKAQGFDLLLANNHIMDFGDKARVAHT